MILKNEVLTVAILAWFVAQILKVLFVLIKYKKIDFTRFIGSGGMPSSHSAFVTAMSFGVGEKMGYSTELFAVCAIFSLIVMYDASGVRRAAGKQAAVLNKLVTEFDADMMEEKLKELLGHTPLEVLAGALLGTSLALFFI